MELIIHSKKYGSKLVHFDDCDAMVVLKYKWGIKHYNGVFYAIHRGCRNQKSILMHRLLMGADSVDIDHRDGNGLNNRRNNLRFATISQNTQNRGKQKNNTTGFKGVVYHGWINKYSACLRANKVKRWGGYFNTAADAAKKYNEMALQYHGEFARLNIIPSQKNKIDD